MTHITPPSPSHRPRQGSLSKGLTLAALLGCVWMLAGCGVTTKLTSPLPIKDFATKSDEAIGLHVPETSRAFVWKGNINVTPYDVQFGNALEPNAKHALSKAFREVTLIDSFPRPSAAGTVGRAVSIEILGANVSPGTLTFSSTAAQLRLKAVLTNAGKTDGEPIIVQGRAEASPGVLGAVPVLGVNQLAYGEALQKAAEQAMADALEKLVEEVLKRSRGRPE